MSVLSEKGFAAESIRIGTLQSDYPDMEEKKLRRMEKYSTLEEPRICSHCSHVLSSRENNFSDLSNTLRSNGHTHNFTKAMVSNRIL
jgi:hypothetical protein